MSDDRTTYTVAELVAELKAAGYTTTDLSLPKDMLRCEFPYPVGVSTNHLYSRTRTGGVRQSDAYAGWRDCVDLFFVLRTSTIAANRPHIVQPNQRLSLTLEVYPPDKRRRDIDNLVKPAMDALFANIGGDDRQVDELHVYRREIRKRGRLILTLGLL